MSVEEPTSGSSEESSQNRREELSSGMSFEDHEDPGGEYAGADPDVLLDIPELKVEELNLEVEDLKTRVALHTRLADLLNIDVGVDVKLEGVKLEAKGVQAVAQLKARLENVQAIIARTLSSVDENPQILDSLTRMSETASGRKDGSQRSPEGSRREPAGGKAGSGQLEKAQPGAGESPEPENPEPENPEPENPEPENPEPENPEPENPEPERLGGGGEITDAARRRAEELGVDTSGIQGMGARGRVLVSDVERVASEGSAAEE